MDYSTESVLTSELAEGRSLAEITTDKKESRETKKQIAHHITDAFIRQFFEYGYFHADPHPGNIFILPENKILFF